MKGVECRNEALWKTVTKVEIANPDSDRTGFLEKGEFRVVPSENGFIQTTIPRYWRGVQARRKSSSN